MKCKICKKETCSCNYDSYPHLPTIRSNSHLIPDKFTEKNSFEENFNHSKVKIHQQQISTHNRKGFLPFDEYVRIKNNLEKCSTCMKNTPPDEASFHQQNCQQAQFCFQNHPEEPPKTSISKTPTESIKSILKSDPQIKSRFIECAVQCEQVKHKDFKVQAFASRPSKNFHVKEKLNDKKSSSRTLRTSSRLLSFSSINYKMGQGDVGSCCGKYILCMFNFIFFILGSFIVGLGLWLLLDKNSLISLMKSVDSEHVERFTEPQLIDQTVYIILAIGGLMFFLGFLGYCGAIRESQCLLSLYGVFLIILLVLEIVVFVFAFAYQDVAREETESFLRSTIKEYRSSAKEKDAVTLMWNQLMAQFKCCGVNSYSDFESSPLWLANKSSRQIPEACCVLSDKTLLMPQDLNCPYAPNDLNSYYMKGCQQSIMDYVMVNCNIIISVVSGLILIQLLAAFLAFCIS